MFEEYITYGGYPAVVLEKDLTLKKELLADLVNSYMKKDALESRLKEELKFFGLVKLLAHQCGDLVNQNKLASDLQTAVGTIDNYLYTLRKCFHIHLLPPKFGTIRKELTKMPKVYFHDLGIRNQICGVFDALDNRFDKGAILENYAFIRLRDIYGIDSLKFWRTADGNEVDFIIETKAQEGLAYEVKFSEKLFYPSKYKKFLEAYPAYPLQTIVFERSTYESNDVFLM